MNRVAFTIFNINIYWYSLCILLGIIIAYFLITKEAKKHNINKDTILDLIFYTLIIGVIGARLYYVIFNLDYYISNPDEILKVWNGGLAIHGGIIFGIIFVYFFSKKKNLQFFKITDICASALILAQGIGRWGNFFNGEAHGGVTTLETLKNMHIPDFIIEGMHIDGNYYYPTFLFESIWCIIGFVILMTIRKRKNIKSGEQTGFYFIWYSVGRFFIEALRTDSLMIFSLKMAQMVSIVGIILGIILIIYSKKNENYNN